MANYSLGTATGTIVIAYDGAGVAAASASIKGVDTTLASTAAKLDSTSKKMAKSGLIIAAGLAVAVDQAATFDSKMNLLVTAAGESPAALQKVAQGIQDIAVKTGTSLDNLADGAYVVEKAGNHGADALTILGAAAEGARAENADLSVVVNALTSIMQSYHLKASDAVATTNQLVAASGLAKTSMQTYAGSLSTVLPIASAAGLSFAQVGGAIATLTQHGTSAQEATQELANTIRNLLSPNQVAQKSMQQLGLSVTDLSQNLGKRGLNGTLDTIVDAISNKLGPSGLVVVNAFKKSQTAGQDLQTMLTKMPANLKSLSEGFLNGTVSAKDYRNGFRDLGSAGYAMGTQFLSLSTTANGFNDLIKSGQPQALTFASYLKNITGGATGMNTALQLTGGSAAYFNNAIDDINKSAQTSGKDINTWAITQQNATVKLGQLRAAGEVLAVNLGNAVLPAVLGVAGSLQKLVQWFSNLSPKTQKIIADTLLGTAAFLLLTSAILKVTSVVLKLASSIISIGKGIATVVTKIAGWITGNSAVAVSQEEVAVATGEADAAQEAQVITANELRLSLINLAIAQEAAAAATDTAGVAMDVAAAEMYDLDAAMDANPIGLIVIAIIALIAIIVLVIMHWKQVKEVMLEVWAAIKTGVVDAINFVKDHWKLIVEILLAPLFLIPVLIYVFWDQIKAAFMTSINAIFSFLQAVWGKIDSYIVQPVVGAFNAVKNALLTAYNFVASIISDILDWFTPNHWRIVALLLGPLGIVIDVITNHLQAIHDFIVAIWTDVFNFLQATWNKIAAIAAAIWNPIAAYFTALYEEFISGVTNIWNAIVAFLTAVWNQIAAIAVAVWDPIAAFFRAIWSAISAATVAAWNAVAAFLTAVWNGIRAAASAAWNAISNTISSIVNSVKNTVTSAFNALSGVASTVWGAIARAVSSAWTATISPITTAIHTAITTVQSAIQTLQGIWDAVWSALSGAISSAWNGAISAALSALSAVLDKIKGILSDITGAIGKVTGGVSKVAGKVGGFLGLDTGGYVPGRKGALATNVRVHGGEYVLSTDMLAGRANVDPNVMAALSSGQVKSVMANMKYGSNAGGATLPVAAAAVPNVRVFIGETELTDMVNVQIDNSLAPLVTMAKQGAL
jgi:TP901 family phage tail tape measure protein